MQRDGEEGRKKLTSITRYVTVGLALIESAAMAIGFGRQGLMDDFNALNVITVIAALTAGSAFLMWIGERITENGVGNGISIVPVSYTHLDVYKRQALKSALTDKVANAKLIVVDELKFEEIKTKNFAQVMKNLDVNNGLVVVNENDVNVMMSAKNIADVKMALPNTINVYDIMKAGKVVLTKDAVKTIEEVYA